MRKIEISLPTVEIIIWLEVNWLGKTILPEIFTIFIFFPYIIFQIFWWRTWCELWKSESKTKNITKVMVNM